MVESTIFLNHRKNLFLTEIYNNLRTLNDSQLIIIRDYINELLNYNNSENINHINNNNLNFLYPRSLPDPSYYTPSKFRTPKFKSLHSSPSTDNEINQNFKNLYDNIFQHIK